jgi:hypothetical protein
LTDVSEEHVDSIFRVEGKPSKKPDFGLIRESTEKSGEVCRPTDQSESVAVVRQSPLVEACEEEEEPQVF